MEEKNNIGKVEVKAEEKNKLEEMQKENEILEKNIALKEKMRSLEALGGKSDGRPQEIIKTDEQVKKEGAMGFFKGTDIERAIRKHG